MVSRPIYRRKGSRQCCDNYRVVSLLSTAGKIFARILLNRLVPHLEDQNLVPENQCLFLEGRGTTDMIFASRQLQEKSQDQYSNLHARFIDPTKGFVTVYRNGLWQMMARYGCPSTW